MDVSKSDNVILCIENELYREYLEHEFAASDHHVLSIGREDIAQAIAEDPSGVLVVQSDGADHDVIEISKKLKRIFADQIKVLLLSPDYLTGEEIGTAVDEFLQYPVPYQSVEDSIRRLKDRTRRILLIDDSRLVHNQIGPPLRAAGYDVVDAFDGQEGLEKAAEMRPDLIICDIEMPRMTGFEACSAIRQTPEIADTYIIMSSTLGSAADQHSGFEAGVDEYITKPVVIPELLDRIDKVFKSALSGRESILILENQEKLAKNISKSLTKQGFTIRLATTIQAMLKILRRFNYDLIISDIDLPDCDPIRLFSALETVARDRRPDVLIITSRDSRADAKMVTNAGAAGVISKPFTVDSLLASVERVLADRRGAQQKAQVEKYMSKASMRMALEKSILSGKAASARAYRKNATIFFSDIAGFTSRCEKYPPKETVSQINSLFEVMTRAIMENGGDIDKFIGDACMAFWLDEDPEASAERALRTALVLRSELDSMNARNPVLAADPIRIRIGLNTGEIILCDLGSAEARMDLTIIGDAVNVAARFESASKQYGLDNLIGESTIKPHLDRYVARLVDWVRVKGKSAAVECYELIGLKGSVGEREERLLERFHSGLEKYRRGEFQEALVIFEEADALERSAAPGDVNPSRVYQGRCRQLIQSPPAEWTGVWTLASK